MSIYKKITKANQVNVEGGYKNVVLFAPVADFSAIATPTATPTVLGDKKKIITAHTFGAADGFISLLCKKHSVTSTSESTGDDGSQSLVHKAKFIILGDGASTLETMEELLNDSAIWLIKDQDCINATDYVQFGDSCLQADHKITFDGKTTKEGLKEYTLEMSVKAKKFFYSGAVTEKPVTTVPVFTTQPVGYTGAAGTAFALFGVATGATSYKWQKGGVDIAGATSNQFIKASSIVGDTGSYTLIATNASGSTTSTAVSVSIT